MPTNILSGSSQEDQNLPLAIPQPQLAADNSTGRIYAYWTPSDRNSAWLDYDPMYFLLRKRRGNNHKVTTQGFARKRHTWVHPAHLNGTTHMGESWYSGQQRDDSGNLMPDRETEWMTAGAPYALTLLNTTPGEWTGFNNATNTFAFPQPVADWGINTNNPTRYTGISKDTLHPANVKSILFRVAIVCRNPDYNPMDPENVNAYMWGPKSDIFLWYPKIRQVITGDEYYQWQLKITTGYKNH